MHIGAHVREDADPLGAAEKCGADVIQFFLADPQGWKAPREHAHAQEIRGTDLTVYTMPNAAKVAHIEARPKVSLNLDSDGQGEGIIVIAGTAAVDEAGVDCRDDVDRCRYACRAS